MIKARQVGALSPFKWKQMFSLIITKEKLICLHVTVLISQFFENIFTKEMDPCYFFQVRISKKNNDFGKLFFSLKQILSFSVSKLQSYL